MIRALLALLALVLVLLAPSAKAQTVPSSTFLALPGSPTPGQLHWVTDGGCTPIPGTPEIGGGPHKDLVSYDATQLRWEFVSRAPLGTTDNDLPTFLAGDRISYDPTASGAAADDVQEALDELFAGGGGGGGGGADNLGNGQATTDVDLNGNDLLEVASFDLDGPILAFPPPDARSMGSGPIATLDFETWFAVDGVKAAGNKSRTDGIRLDHVNLTEAESFALWIDAIAGGDSDLVGVGIRAACMGGAQDDGDEGCAALRTHVFDQWYEAVGSVTGTIPAGAGTRTLTITGIQKDESRQLGQGRYFVLTALGSPVDIVDVPPGVISSTGQLDAGDATWLGTGMASGQGVFTLGAGQVTSASVDPGDCIRANATGYTPFLGGVSAYQWLRIVSTNPGTNQITTEWIGQGVDSKTPYGYLADEGGVGTEAVVAPCGLVVQPLFTVGNDKIADSLIVDFAASFPGASSPAFTVPAYGAWRIRAHQSLVSQMLAGGGGAGSYGHSAVNDLATGRYQIQSGYQVGIGGPLSNLKDGTRHGMLYGFDCATEPGACQYGPSFRYLDDPDDEDFLQAFGFVRFSSEDWLDDIPRPLIYAFNDPTKSVTLDRTDGLGENGDPYLQVSQLNTPNGSGPSTSSSGRFVEWSQIEGMPAGFADGSDDGSSGGATDLNGLTDVVLTTPAQGAALVFDGTNWLDGMLDLADPDTFTGELPDARVSNFITASNYLPLAGGTLSGSLNLSAGQAINVPTGAVVQASGSGAIYATNVVGAGSATPAVDLNTAEVAGVLAVTQGGTGASGHTNGGILLGTLFGAIHSTPVLAAGQLLIGDGTTDPTIAAMSGDALMTSGGVVSFQPNTVDGNELVATGVSPGTYQAATVTVDADGRVTAIVQGTNLLVASGTKALATGVIGAGACATDTATATGVASTDVVAWNPNADLSAVVGYRPISGDGLAIYPPVPTANLITFKVCNPTASPITPGAVTLNYRVTR